jgi:hypothetical protein
VLERILRISDISFVEEYLQKIDGDLKNKDFKEFSHTIPKAIREISEISMRNKVLPEFTGAKGKGKIQGAIKPALDKSHEWSILRNDDLNQFPADPTKTGSEHIKINSLTPKYLGKNRINVLRRL